MRKFLAFTNMAWQEGITYRAKKILWTIINVGGMIPILSLWFVLGQSGKISPTQSHYLVIYYLIIVIVSRLTASDMEEWLIDDIKDGQISRDIIRPFPFFIRLFASDFVWRMSYIFYIFPLMIILWFLIPHTGFLLLIPMTIIVYFQRFFIAMLIAFTAFWIDQSNSLTHLKWMLGWLVSGSMLPLTFFPDWFQNVARWTPFYSWGFFTAQLAMGKLNLKETMVGILLTVFWTVLLFICAKLLWKKSLRQYGAVGT